MTYKKRSILRFCSLKTIMSKIAGTVLHYNTYCRYSVIVCCVELSLLINLISLLLCYVPSGLTLDLFFVFTRYLGIFFCDQNRYCSVFPTFALFVLLWQHYRHFSKRLSRQQLFRSRCCMLFSIGNTRCEI